MAELLRVDALRAGYGGAVVLDGVSFAVGEGRSLALLGRNGTGKTTLIDTLVGVTRRIAAGRSRSTGAISRALRPDQRAAAGIGWVPQERNIFKSLTVEENLTAVARPGPWTPARVYEMFPRLAERNGNLGTQLSGGEQQMLAIGRALMLNPRLLLLDEPLEGLAPIIVEELLRVLDRASCAMKDCRRSSSSRTREDPAHDRRCRDHCARHCRPQQHQRFAASPIPRRSTATSR